MTDTIIKKMGLDVGDKLFLEGPESKLVSDLKDALHGWVKVHHFQPEEEPQRLDFYRWSTHCLRIDAGESLVKKNREIEEFRVKHRRWMITMLPVPVLAERAGITEPELSTIFEAAMKMDLGTVDTGEPGIKQFGGLTMDVRLPWVMCSGRHNLPDGEVFSSPEQGSVNGTVVAPFLLAEDKEFRDLELTFVGGILVEASHNFMEVLPDDGARRIGEIGIGLNKGVPAWLRTGETLLDEKAYGTFHIALGAALPAADNGNRRAIHWDVVVNL